MFDEFVEIVRENGGGARAYEACLNAARQRMRQSPDMAAGCFFIAFAAQRFVDAYWDQPLPKALADEEFATFRDLVTSLSDAYRNGSDADRLAALNRAAARISEI